MTDLPRYAWSQAHDLHFATARGFAAFRIPASTIRRWAHEGRIQAVGKAPGGAHLYRIQEVSVVAGKLGHTPTGESPCK